MAAGSGVSTLAALIGAGGLCVPDFYPDDIQSVSDAFSRPVLFRPVLKPDAYQPLPGSLTAPALPPAAEAAEWRTAPPTATQQPSTHQMTHRSMENEA